MAKFWYLSFKEIKVCMTSPKNFKFCRRATTFILVLPVADSRGLGAEGGHSPFPSDWTHLETNKKYAQKCIILHKIKKNSGVGLLLRFHVLPFRPLFQTSGSASVEQLDNLQ